MLDESTTILRFLSGDVAARVDAMMAAGDLDLEVEFDAPTETHPPVQLGWVTVGGDTYRCKVVLLPTQVETYVRGGDREHFHKAGELAHAVVVAEAPDNLREQNQASLVLESLPVRASDGLTAPTRGILDHYALLDSVLCCAPSEADVAQLVDTAAWLEATVPREGRNVSVTAQPP
eukprot:TRINITY_DN8549_c1_g1_i1.p1 TRINITY_DN8549_c1_g1~~TRINITY_DN8549_c1_g1_i1.p1  ORF type:complete len:176 (+),score=48.86 TRINITY_DN8549_c1_g1_i1:229-756(+)